MSIDTLEPDDPAGDLESAVIDRTANNQRLAPRAVDVLADDIDDVNPDDTDDDPELSRDAELAVWPSPLRGPVERFANRPLPTVASTVVSAKWWTRTLGYALAQIVLHFPVIFLNQIPHVWRGLLISAEKYATYRGKGRWLEAAHAADPNARALRVEKVEHAKRGATRLTALTLFLLAAGVVALIVTAQLMLLAWSVVALLTILNLVGRRQAPNNSGVAIMPRSAFTEGAPSRMVVEDVTAVLVERGHDPERLAVVEPRVGEHGLSMTIHSPREIVEDDVTAIERGLQTFRGAASVLAEPGNAAVTELRLMWSDPLAASALPLRLAPNSVSIADPAVLGYGLGGQPLELNLMRTNVFIVGSPGSGKSSSLWVLIDWLSCCRDVVLHGIDLSGGPMLSAWGDVFATRATNRDEAEALLRDRNAAAIERTRMLARRSEPRVDGPPPGSENWTPADGKFHIIIIDELPLLATDETLVELYAEHQRIGRKAGDTSVAAAQDLGGKTIGATSLRKYPSTIIMHACSREDVVTALGGGKVKEGWQPHRFVAAEGDTPNDAGKCMIKSGRHTRPVPWRMARLDVSEIHSRAIERMAAGRPSDDDPVIVDEGAVIPDALARVLAAFADHDNPEFLTVAEIVESVNARRDKAGQLSNRDLTASLRDPWQIETKRPRIDGETSPRGYWRKQVQDVVDQQ